MKRLLDGAGWLLVVALLVSLSSFSSRPDVEKQVDKHSIVKAVDVLEFDLIHYEAVESAPKAFIPAGEVALSDSYRLILNSVYREKLKNQLDRCTITWLIPLARDKPGN